MVASPARSIFPASETVVSAGVALVASVPMPGGRSSARSSTLGPRPASRSMGVSGSGGPTGILRLRVRAFEPVRAAFRPIPASLSPLEPCRARLSRAWRAVQRTVHRCETLAFVPMENAGPAAIRPVAYPLPSSAPRGDAFAILSGDPRPRHRALRVGHGTRAVHLLQPQTL